MTLHLRVGFMPLVDCALVVLAKDEGFAEAEGLNLELVREVSWSNLRDKLNVRLFDAATCSAPRHRRDAGRRRRPRADGGAARAQSRRRGDHGHAAPLRGTRPPRRWRHGRTTVSARALAALVARRKASGLPPLTLAAVFGFSSHTYLICEWLAKAGLALGTDIRFEVVPPPQTVEALRSGRVDGFCAGAPWKRRRVRGRGRRDGPHQHGSAARLPRQGPRLEADDLERRPAAVQKLSAAILRASDWACDPPTFRASLPISRRPTGSRSRSRSWSLSCGSTCCRAPGDPAPGRALHPLRPRGAAPGARSRAWILAGMDRAGQVVQTPGMLEQARAVFRPAAFPGETV